MSLRIFSSAGPRDHLRDGRAQRGVGLRRLRGLVLAGGQESRHVAAEPVLCIHQRAPDLCLALGERAGSDSSALL